VQTADFVEKYALSHDTRGNGSEHQGSGTAETYQNNVAQVTLDLVLNIFL
jgi:hypothetical protein